jgi:Domain of unknown function (DUF4082)/Galactose oxidase-like, Early set domain/IPT/TIG domain/Kelch motif
MARRSTRFTLGLVTAILLTTAATAHAQTNVVGQWTSVQPLPYFPVHSHLLPNGKVMVWPGDGGVSGDDAASWDPATEAVTFLSKSGYDLFCSGHTWLSDGTLFVAGGHIQNYVGLPTASAYDPVANTWRFFPSMNAGRWYPTATPLANGDVLVVSGDADLNVGVNTLPQVFQASTGTWRDLTSATLGMDLYPQMLLSPNGQVFNAGPSTTTRYLDTSGTGTWTVVGTRPGSDSTYGSAVMYDTGKVLAMGGGDPPMNTAAVIDLNQPSPTWRSVGAMTYARRQLNAVLLPDGKVLVTGGTSGPGFNDTTSPVFAAEMWDPVTEQWTVMASATIPRLYHSAALLLPDGRVLSSGGNGYPDTEVYSPPYLFKGARPTIASAPTAIDYGKPFVISTPDAASIGKVTLIRLPSVTHAFNQSQRLNSLTFTKQSGSVTAVAPAAAALAPPGPYMLFVVNTTGVPSVAQIVQLGTAVTPPIKTCPCSIWSPSDTPAILSNGDPQAIEVGVKFMADVNGSITALRFYKGDQNTGTHIGNLWTATGTLLASATFTGETPSGWQEVTLPTPVTITAHTTYVVSYHTDAGFYSVTYPYFTSAFNNPPLRALADGQDGPNGLYKYGASGFPTSTFQSANYWVDVVFIDSGGSPPGSPTGTALTPNSAQAGSPAFTLTVTGTNFVSGATVKWNGAARATTFVSATQLTAAIPATDVATEGAAQITVANPDGSASNALTFTVTSMPTITALSPNTAQAGSPAFTLTVSGTKFVSGATVNWNGASRSTTFVSATQLTAAIPATDVATAGTPQIIVVNPEGEASNAFTFTVTSAPAPTLSALSPNSAQAGSPAFTLTVTGTNFVSGATVKWNGAARTTTFGSATQLTAAIPATDVAAAGTAQVTVANPGGGTSSALAFTVTSTSAPTLSALSPNSAQAGSPAFTLTVTGTNFVSGATVKWNGAARTTTFGSATQLTAAIPATDVAAAGTAQITVVNPGGGTSSALTFTVTSCPCSIWTNAATPAVASNNDPNAIEVGVRFRSSSAGYIKGIRFYKGSSNVGPHTGKLWTATGTLLASATFSGETASGWQQVQFATPVAIAANTVYVASYYTASGFYSTTYPYFTSGVNSPPLYALANGEAGGNGLYKYGTGGGFPTSTFNSANYWVDVVFDYNNSTSGPTLTSLSPSSAPAGGPAFTLTVTGSNFASGATVRWNGSSRTTTFVGSTQLTAAIAAADIAAVGTAQVTVANPGGSVSSALPFTVTAACPCNIWGSATTPAVPSNNDPQAIEVGVRFQSDRAGYIKGIRFYKGSSNVGPHTGKLWTATGTLLASATFSGESASGWQEVRFATSVAIAANTVYVASYYTASGFYSVTYPYFTSPVSSPPLRALANGDGGGNGLYRYGTGGGFPTSTFNSANYWVDVVFDDTP